MSTAPKTYTYGYEIAGTLTVATPNAPPHECDAVLGHPDHAGGRFALTATFGTRPARRPA